MLPYIGLFALQFTPGDLGLGVGPSITPDSNQHLASMGSNCIIAGQWHTMIWHCTHWSWSEL